MRRVYSLRKSFIDLLYEVSRVALPLLVFVLVSSDLKNAAFGLVFLFKWRVFAVQSRFWAASIRANAVDILIGLSVVEFMDQTSIGYRFVWLAAYVLWVLYIKKLSKQPGIIAQGIIAFVVSLSALIGNFESLEHGLVLAGAWAIAYFCARHILGAFREDHAPALAHIWGLFVVQLTWVLWHWQVWYWFISQLVLISGIALTGMSIVYAMSKSANPNKPAMKQILVSSSLMMLVVVLMHNWRETNF